MNEEIKRRFRALCVAIVLTMVIAVATVAIPTSLGSSTGVLADDDGGDDDDSDDDDDDDDGRDDDDLDDDNGETSISGNGSGNDSDGDDDDGADERFTIDRSGKNTSGTVSATGEFNGQLRIIAATCAAIPANDDDWESTCTGAVERTRIEIIALEGNFAGWIKVVQINANGLSNDTNLPSGQYQIDQLDDEWCHAESDRVDDDGDVLIAAGEVTTVWIFNCDESSDAK